MGKAKPKSNAASPVVLPPTATRKRAQVPDKHEPDKCKALKEALDEEEHGADVLKWDLEEKYTPDEVVDEKVVEEDDGSAKLVKEAEGVAVMDDSEYHHPIGLLAVTCTLVSINNYCILSFYFCGISFLVERVYF
jgi:hypothetical protein